MDSTGTWLVFHCHLAQSSTRSVQEIFLFNFIAESFICIGIHLLSCFLLKSSWETQVQTNWWAACVKLTGSPWRAIGGQEYAFTHHIRISLAQEGNSMGILHTMCTQLNICLLLSHDPASEWGPPVVAWRQKKP